MRRSLSKLSVSAPTGASERDDDDRSDNSQNIEPPSWLFEQGGYQGLRAAPSGCMSGTLGDVFLFRPHGGFPGVAAEGASGGMALDEKDGGVSNKPRKDNNNGFGNTNIEWQQLLKDGVNANAENRSMFGDSDSGSLPVLTQPRFHFMGSLAGARSGGPWDCPRADGTAVNYLQAFGPGPAGSNSGVDEQLGDRQHQMLTDVLRRPSSSCEVAAEIPGGVKEEEEFGCGADSSSTISSHVLQGGTISSSGQQQQLFVTPRGLMPSPASMQQLNRSPNHAIRNLFPEKSSSFSSAMLQSHEELGVNKIDEQGLLQLPKKARMQDYGDGGLASSPLSLSEGDTSNRLSHGSGSGQYRKVPFAHDQRSNALASLIDCSSSYSKSPATSFPPSFTLADRSTAFDPSNLSLQNPTISLSSFQNSRCSLLPMKSLSNDGISMKPPIVDYGNYTLDPSSRIQGGGDYRAELLGSVRDPSSFLGVSNRQSGLNFMPLGGSMGSGPPNFSCRRQSSLDTVGGGAWPSGLISNIPSLTMETPSRQFLPPKRTLHDRGQPDGLLEDTEPRRIHPVTESRRRMLIQKQLTTTDVGSLGRIILPKKEAETHLPHLPDKEGMEMYMYDYEADRTWTMKYRFWPNNKSRMYLLENTGEFAKFHALQQGDWLFIYRESVSRYVLRAKKLAPLVQVTPSSQPSVTEPSAGASGGPAAAGAEDEGRATGASGRVATNQSPSPASTTDGGSVTPASKDMVCGTPAPTSNQHSLDVPSLRFPASSGGAVSVQNPPQQIVVDAKNNPVPPRLHHQQQHEQLTSGTLSSNNKHLVHHMQPVVRAPAASRGGIEDDQRHHEQQQQENQGHRLKNYMAVQQQQPDHDMPSELDGGGEFNLEDFPRLIEADDETIDNILGHSEQSHVSISRTLSLRGRDEDEPSSSSRRSI